MDFSEQATAAFPETPDGMSLTELFVVSPYLGPGAFEVLVEQYGEPSLGSTIITDPSTPLATLLDCSEAVGETRMFYTAGNLMHAKLYLLVFADGRGNKRSWLVFGSANASAGGLLHGGNHEAIAAVRLGDAQLAPLRVWLGDLVSSLCADAIVVRLRPNVVLALPSLSGLVEIGEDQDGEPANVDAWLRAGVLIHEWNPEPDFARLPIRLDDTDRELRQALQAADLERPSSGVVRIPFLQPPTRRPRRQRRPLKNLYRWKSRYCVETNLGLWVSRACAAALGRRFRRANWRQRYNDLQRLVELEGQSPDELFNGPEAAHVLQYVDRAAEAVLQIGRRPEAVFGEPVEAAQQRALDQVVRVVNRDARRTSDQDFCDRYTTGVDQLPLPGFTVDTPAWGRFVDSWCTSVCIQLARVQTGCRLAARLRGVLPAVDLTAAALREALEDEYVVEELLDYFVERPSERVYESIPGEREPR